MIAGQTRVHKALAQFTGCKVAFVYQMCWPAFILNVDVAVLTAHDVTATAFFILRLANQGVTQIRELSFLLGLPDNMVLLPVAELAGDGLLERIGGESFRITSEGRKLIEQAGHTMQPQTKTLQVPYNPITRTIIDSDITNLTDIAAVRKEGFFVIPDQGDRPLLGDLNIEEVRRYAQNQFLTNTPDEEITGVVAIHEQSGQVVRYRNDIFVVGLSEEHSRRRIFAVYCGDAFLPMESSVLQRLWDEGRNDIVPDEYRDPDGQHQSWLPWEQSTRISADEIRLLDELEQNDAAIARMTQAIAAAETNRQATQDLTVHEQLGMHITELEGQRDQLASRMSENAKRLHRQTDGTTRLISTEEHRPLLLKSIDQAMWELTLVSAWVRPEAFDAELRERLSQALTRGVSVRIAWGLGTRRGSEAIRNRNIGEAAIRALQQSLPQHAQERLVTKRTETHEKFVICDDRFCVWGSFNWLSYRGQLDSGYRRETSFYSERSDDIALWKNRAFELFG